MAKPIYFTPTSLDGYIADESGNLIRVLPSNLCVKLDLLDERRFANGMVYPSLAHVGLMEAVAPRTF